MLDRPSIAACRTVVTTALLCLGLLTACQQGDALRREAACLACPIHEHDTQRLIL